MARVDSGPSQLRVSKFDFSNARDNLRAATGRETQGVPVIFSVTVNGSGYAAADDVTLSLNNPASGGGSGATDLVITVGGGSVTGVSNPNLNGFGYRIGDVLNVVGGGGNATVTVTAVQYLLGKIPDNAIIKSVLIDCSTAFSETAGTPVVQLRVGTGGAASGGSNITIKTANFDASPWDENLFQYTTVAKTAAQQDVILLVKTKDIDAGIASVWINFYQSV